jgi:ABC-type transporter Mla subunit MlaD
MTKTLVDEATLATMPLPELRTRSSTFITASQNLAQALQTYIDALEALSGRSEDMAELTGRFTKFGNEIVGLAGSALCAFDEARAHQAEHLRQAGAPQFNVVAGKA